MTDGGCAPTPLLPFRVRAIQSFVGHAISIVSNSNMVETPKQKWNGLRPVNQRLPYIFIVPLSACEISVKKYRQLTELLRNLNI